ncbi:MAG: hypothetical protein ACE5FJ_08910 [Gemmatimonadales bacterium]
MHDRGVTLSGEPTSELLDWTRTQVEAGRTDINIVRHLQQRGVDDATIVSLGSILKRSFDPQVASRYRRQPHPVTRLRLIKYSISGSAMTVALVAIRMTYRSLHDVPAWLILSSAAISGAVVGALFLLLEPMRFSRHGAGAAYSIIGVVATVVYLLPAMLAEEFSAMMLLAVLLVGGIGGLFVGRYLQWLADANDL